MNSKQIKQLEAKIGVAIKVVTTIQSDFAFNTDPITMQQKRLAQQKLRELGYQFMQLRTNNKQVSKRVWVKPETVKNVEVHS